MDKKYITIGVIVLLVLGFAFYLFKISPNTSSSSLGGQYNAELLDVAPKTLSFVPPFDPAIDHFQGDPKAKNVLIEYADYQCPACASISPILKQVPTEIPDTVLVYRYFPLVQIHPNSSISALAAEAAGLQGKYWEMHDILYEKQTEWQESTDPSEAFASYAQSIGVANIDQFKKDLKEKKNFDAVKNGYAEAMGLKLSGTPSLFYNGTRIEPANLDGLKKQIEALKAK